MDYHKICKKLIGRIYPVGETITDDERFENLKEMANLINNLLSDMDDIVVRNKDSQEFSVRRSVEFVEKFFNDIGIN